MLDDYIFRNHENLEFEKEEGFLALCSTEKVDLEIPDLPKYPWLIIERDKIRFDIKVYNKWKRDRIHDELRDLIGIKFFNKFALTHLESMFGKTTTAKKD